MRSASSLLLCLLLAAGANAAAAAPDDALTEAEVGAAVERLQQDPNLVRQTHKTRRLQWKPSAPQKAAPPPAENLFQFLARSMQVILWTLGAIAAALGLVWALRVARARSPRSARAAAAFTARVQDLDVRPALLPDDIGSAAAALLAAGRLREALSLLYRGALSRAIHRHGIAIAESSTEGEVLARVSPRLAPPGAQYFGRLVNLRQQAVYAAQLPPAEAIAALCREFALLETGA